MPIKLLSKQEINQRQATQKRAEIDEGRKLAQRVDNLREIAVTEEASLASFRAKTLKAINTEIQLVSTERDLLIIEVNSLRAEIKAGLAEVTRAKESLSEEKDRIISREEELRERIALVEKKEAQIKKDFEHNKRLLRKIEYINDRLMNIGPVVEERLFTAESALGEIELKKFQFDTFYLQITKELHDKDIAVASRERDITIKEERVMRTERQLKDREIQLHDRELTLEREFNRLKNKK